MFKGIKRKIVMSMYADYMKEKENLESYECEYGFITYKKMKDALYIGDFYVKPQYRGSKHTTAMSNYVETIAKEAGCTMMLAEVNTKDNKPEQGMYVQLRHGYKFSHIVNNSIIYFYKRI